MNKPSVTRCGILDMQVCVPSTFSDEQVEEFANRNNPAGTEAGWAITKEGDPVLAGDPERIACQDRDGYVHIMLQC